MSLRKPIGVETSPPLQPDLQLAMVFNDLKINRIEAFVDPDNIASQRVLIKSGMHCEGLLKNHTIFKGNLRDSYLYSISKL